MRKLAILSTGYLIVAWLVGQSPSSQDQMISLGAHRLQIHRDGVGTPAVVLDAGLGEGLTQLRALQERVARVTCVIAYNRAGYGQSEAGPLPRDSGREAAELRAVLEKAAVPGPSY